MNAFVTIMQEDALNFLSFTNEFDAEYSSGVGIFIDDFIGKLKSFSTEVAYLQLLGVDSRGESATSQYAMIVELNQYHALYLASLSRVDRSRYSSVLAINNNAVLGKSVACNDVDLTFWEAVDGLISNSTTEQLYNATLNHILSNVPVLSACAGQYGTFLSIIQNWINTVRLNDTLPTPACYVGFLSSFDDNEQSLRDIIKAYTNYSLSKLDMSGRINSVMASMETNLANVTTIMNAINSDLATNVAAFSGSITATLSVMMTFLNYLAQYNTKNGNVTVFARKLTIWTSPTPQVDSDEVCSG